MDRGQKSLYEGLPEAPGVYIMKSARGAILYVGKASNLRRRVSSYFTRPHDSRIESLVAEIASIGHEDTDTAIEALILESALIKRHMPPYNVREKDDKSFLYVVFTKDTFPRVLLVRGKDRAGDEKDIYGPFVAASSARAALRIMRRIFPFSDHIQRKSGSKPFDAAQGKPCFNCQIGLCPGTCVKAISRADYAKNIRNLKLFFRGEKKKIIRSLEADMKRYGKALQFEKAEAAKRKIFALQHIQDTALIGENAVEGAGDAMRIEGYDVSNISGTNPVGAMVVFSGTKPDKKEYRLFNIKGIMGPDDTGMMREMLERRLDNSPSHPKNSEKDGVEGDDRIGCGGRWPLPQMILVDGGQGQANVAEAVLMARGISIPVVGIAKGADRKGNRFVGKIPEGVAEKTLIAVRDEAHRFSRAGHIRRRGKAFLPS